MDLWCHMLYLPQEEIWLWTPMKWAHLHILVGTNHVILLHHEGEVVACLDSSLEIEGSNTEPSPKANTFLKTTYQRPLYGTGERNLPESWVLPVEPDTNKGIPPGVL